MSYEVVIGSESEADLAEASFEVLTSVEQALQLLANDPVNLGVRSHFPHPPHLGQIFQFPAPSVRGGVMRVFFRYDPAHSAENRIIVTGFAPSFRTR